MTATPSTVEVIREEIRLARRGERGNRLGPLFTALEKMLDQLDEHSGRIRALEREEIAERLEELEAGHSR